MISNPFPFYIYTPIKPSYINTTITLTSKEIEIFNTITSILKANNCTSTICRVAGGWVRDKILGKDSIDIDIALSDMKGVDLAKMINAALYPDKDKVGLIHQNAEKGKHLETATIRVCDIWIDFVNLRSDDENKIGTPLEDAERRDITINSLFYNINTNTIEDFTKKGIDDLRNGIIRTPIPAIKTFKDDPLRILRSIRFATKYEFDIDNDIANSIKENIVEFKKAYSEVISNERITKELTLILEGKHPATGIYLIYKYDLLYSMLKCDLFNNDNKKIDKNQNINEKTILDCVNIFVIGDFIIHNIMGDNDIQKALLNDIDTGDLYKKSMYLLLLTSVFRNYLLKGTKENSSYSKIICKDVLKLPNEETKDITILTSLIDEFISIVNNKAYTRLSIGKLLRNIKYVHLYKMIITSMAIEYISLLKDTTSIINIIDQGVMTSISNKYREFIKYCLTENLLHIDDMKPLLDGQAIISTLQISPGKEIGVLLESLVDRQIEMPTMSHSAAVEFLNKKREEIKGKYVTESNKKSGKKNKKK